MSRPEKIKTLHDYYAAVASGQKRFENVFQALERMIFDRPNAFERISVCGEDVYDYQVFFFFFRHPVESYRVIEELVTFIRSAARFGPSRDQAFVIFGEPGNGKTNLVTFLMKKYVQFLHQPGNEKYTFVFVNLDHFKMGEEKLFGGLTSLESQTYEDPMILLMNWYSHSDDAKELMAKFGFSEADIERHWRNYRPLGADSDYLVDLIREEVDGDFEEALKRFIRLSPIRISGSQGIMVGKLTAKDKYTANASELVGRPSVLRMMHIKETDCPLLIDVRAGCLARVAGGGIHFADELFKHTEDYVKIYLGVIQDREIEVNSFIWPMDTFIIATSNNDNLAQYQAQEAESPILNRCKLVPMPHVINYHQQRILTRYCLGDTKLTTVGGEEMHEDPNLVAVASDICVLSRLPDTQELTLEELRLLCAGEAAGDKSPKTLQEVIDRLNSNKEFGQRFAMKGINHRTLQRAFINLMSYTSTHENRCMSAWIMFKAFEAAIIDDVTDAAEADKYLKRLENAKRLYRDEVERAIFNAYMDDPDAVRRSVLDYVNMVMALKANRVSKEGYFHQRDPVTGEPKMIKFREDFVKAVQKRMGIENEEQREEHISYVSGLYGVRVHEDPGYDFMDQQELVKAVVDVLLKSDISGAGTLVGILANRTQAENEKVYNRMIDTMMNKLGYCESCAKETIERWLEFHASPD